MGRNNTDFHYGHGFGFEPKIGPTSQRLAKTDRWLPNGIGSIIGSYSGTEKTVRIASIKSMQRDVKAKTVSELAAVPSEDIEPIKVWKDSRGLRMIDGNHRANAAIARGETHIKARVYDSKDYR